MDVKEKCTGENPSCQENEVGQMQSGEMNHFWIKRSWVILFVLIWNYVLHTMENTQPIL